MKLSRANVDKELNEDFEKLAYALMKKHSFQHGKLTGYLFQQVCEKIDEIEETVEALRNVIKSDKKLEDICEMNLDEVRDFISSISDLDTLETLLKVEKENPYKNGGRVGAIKAIEERRATEELRRVERDE